MKSKIFFLLPIFLMLAILLDIVSAAVTIKYFKATTIDLKVILEWETEKEPDILYFVILRSDQEDGNFTLVSDLIYAQGSPESGLLYQFIDSNVKINQTYFYKLEAVNNNYQSQFFGPLSITVLSATYTKTSTPSKTLTVTGTITPNTLTPTPTLNQTRTETPTVTPTSPFSFVTNTPTPTFTFTSRFTQKPTRTPLTKTPEPSKTYEIIKYHTNTPYKFVSKTPTPSPTLQITSKPIRSGAIGFGVAVLIGTIVLISLVLLQKQKNSHIN